LFQVSDVFRDPYDSRDIGLVRVWGLDVQEVIWLCEDVVSKCYIHPWRPKNKDQHNPLPNGIRSATTYSERKERFDALFGITDITSVKWNVHSLLLPINEKTKKLMTNIVNVELSLSDDEDEDDDEMMAMEED